MAEANGNEQGPGDEGQVGGWASFFRRSKSPDPRKAPGSPGPGPITQGVQRGLKTLGLSPEGIDYDRLGEVMEQAMAAGLKDFASDVANQPGRPSRQSQSARNEQKQQQQQYDPRRFPKLGSRGMVGLAGMALLGRFGNTGPGLSATPDIETGQGGGLGGMAQAITMASRIGQATQVVPGAAPEGATMLPGAAQAAEGGAVGEATSVAQRATTAVAGEAAAAGGGLRQILGAGMLGYSAGGLSGGWEGIAGASEGAAGVLGPLGIGYTIAHGLYDTANQIGGAIASQRHQNAYYQSILGGSNLAGMGQRALQTGFRLSTLGNLTGGQANALFQGVTGLDMTGAQRTNAMDQAIQMYDDLGVSIQTSLQLITTAATNGNRELAGLADSIKSVTQAAVAGQVNANVARQTFGNLVQAAANNGVQGVPAQTLSRGMTNALSALGPEFQGVDMTGVFGQMPMIQMANAVGMNPDKFLGLLNQGNTPLFSRAFNKVMGRYGQQLGMQGNIAGAVAGLSQAERNAIGKGHATQADINDVAYQMEVNDPTGGLGYAAMAALQQQGINVTDPTRALEMFAAAQLHVFNPQTTTPTAGRGRLAQVSTLGTGSKAVTTTPTVAELDKNLNTYIQQNFPHLPKEQRDEVLARGKAAIRQMSTPEGRRNGLSSADQELYGQVTQMYHKQYAEQTGGQSAAAAAAIGNPNFRSAAWESIFGPTAGNRADEWYMTNIVGKKHERDPVMERLLKRKDLNNAQTLFNVDVGGGNTVLATAQDLEKHYMKAVQSGQVTVASASDPNLVNQSIAKLLGIQAQKGEVVSGVKYAATAAGRKEQAALQKQVAAQTKNLVTIQMAPGMAKYFTLNAQGNVNVANDSQTATNNNGFGYPAPSIPG